MGYQLKAMGLCASTSLFLGAGVITGILFVYGFGALIDAGCDFFTALHIVGLASFLLLGITAAVLYRREGHLFTWQALKTRLRLKPMTGRAWLYTAAAYVVVLASYLGLLFTARIYAEYFPLPQWYRIPADISVVGAYGMILSRTLLVTVNVLCEEFLWRGYVLPRQELAHGKHTWWIHGTQWACFHLFKPWEFLMLWPGCLAYGWVCTKTQSTTPGIILHFGLNGLGIVMVTLAVFGIIS